MCRNSATKPRPILPPPKWTAFLPDMVALPFAATDSTVDLTVSIVLGVKVKLRRIAVFVSSVFMVLGQTRAWNNL